MTNEKGGRNLTDMQKARILSRLIAIGSFFLLCAMYAYLISKIFVAENKATDAIQRLEVCQKELAKTKKSVLDKETK